MTALSIANIIAIFASYHNILLLPKFPTMQKLLPVLQQSAPFILSISQLLLVVWDSGFPINYLLFFIHVWNEVNGEIGNGVFEPLPKALPVRYTLAKGIVQCALHQRDQV